MTKTPAYPLHLIAETTPGMHPWETLPGSYDTLECAVGTAQILADQRNIKIHVNDKNGNFWRKITPIPVHKLAG